jgi:predicted AlkP superfamily pyrophosphatase or phosphodiesterase
VTPTVVLNVVGLTPGLLEHAPNLQGLAREGAVRPLTTVLPAVTTTVQSTMLTGSLPRDHGIVANGWYFRDLSEVWLWRQSNRLVHGEKVWEAAKRRDPAFTCAQLFWWYNMYASVDIAVTPRPMYLADGRKLPDIHTHPAGLRDEGALGTFPLFQFWGPGAGIASSAWIANSSLRDEAAPADSHACLSSAPGLRPPDWGRTTPTFRPGRGSRSLCAADRGAGRVRMWWFFRVRHHEVSRPVHINRALREAGCSRCG